MASTLVTLPREVVLRSGQRVPFDAERIRAALASAGQASGEYGAEEAALLTAQVTKVLIHRFHGEAPTVEQIQDVAEQTLIAANHLATARAYIVYREQHATLRADKQTLVGYLHAGDEVGLWAALDRLMELGKQSLETKRKLIQRLMDQGLFPYTKRYLGTLRNHFSTLGVNGINEMVRNFTHGREDITSDFGHALALRLLDHVRERMTQFQEETGHLYNLEATPAEGTTYRFAKEDKKRWPHILQAGTAEQPYYTNSSQLPVGFTDDPFEALMRQEALQSKYTGGTVLHLYMGERVSSGAACRELVKRALTNFRLPYITVTPTFSICPTHGYLAGEHPFCPRCDEERLAAKRAQLAA
ncbi:anaerobic ribonucleoside-triphosphate reductase [uncultured Acidovorax sp.]|uniref:anaerobic ribonucleoside-triphosphate reductase n=1 Tax=uncultured Acidovorax sp. TaxID=158751 RepID=UPI00258F2073|nr:anaerobic ribonucleoside-triphosphate reductase [uncultured Acidovorax sp.]